MKSQPLLYLTRPEKWERAEVECPEPALPGVWFAVLLIAVVTVASVLVVGAVCWVAVNR